MNRLSRQVVFGLGLLLLAHATTAGAQTTVYHLHNGDSGDFCCRVLTTTAPGPPSVALQSADLKNRTGSAYLWAFQTIAGTGLGGTIASGSTVQFSLRMKKTANWGVILPQARLDLGGTTTVCSAVGSTALVQSPAGPVTFSCSPSTGIPQNPGDKLRVWVGYSLATPPGNHSVKVELDIDGTTDSTVSVPNPIPPQITSVNPLAGPVNWNVTIGGTNFGSSQGSSTLTFNGTSVLSSDTTWTDTSITTKVPVGATSGPVVVSVRGVNSTCSGNCNFTVIPPPSLLSVTPSSAHRGDTVTITGANFMQSQGSSTVAFGTEQALPGEMTWSDTSIVTKVPASATGGPVVVTVSGQPSNGLPFTVIIPGTIAGTITRASDSTPLQNATVQAVLAGVIKAAGTTPADGTYSLPNVDPGTYDVRVLATGYSSEVRSVAVTSSTTSTVNVAMSRPGSVSGLVTAGGTTPLAGAAVTVFLDGTQKGNANTDGTGAYSIGGLHPGSYTLQVVDVGYRTKEQGVVITENANTSADVSLDAAPAGPVSYAYDALGRLVSVVDPYGDAATYNYDAVGNILSIGRIGAGTVAITQVTPGEGAVGTPVTIYGTGFGATPAENTVTFYNGKQALITSSTPTRIVTSVPVGAESGPLAVTAPLGSATSTFTVSASLVPTIISFTPGTGSAGDTVTVTGTNFDPIAANDRVTVNQSFATVTSASATSLALTIPSPATSGPISVATVNGTAVCTNDLIIPPLGHTSGDIVFTSRIGYGDANAITVPVNTAEKIGLVLFDGVAGHHVAFKVSNVSYTGGLITVLTPYGAQIARDGFTTNGNFLEPVPLRVDGTYSVIIAPNSTNTGSVLLTVYDVPADVIGTIVADGDTVTATSTTPGQNALYTFAGVVNQRVSLSVGAGPAGTVSILSPAGVALGQSVTTGSNPVFFDTVTLAEEGTYTVFVNPSGANVGSLSLTLHNAPDVPYSITPGGQAVNVATTVPGQRAVASFTATAGHRVSLDVTNVLFPSGLGCKGTISIVDVDGVALRSYSCLLTSFNTFLDVTDALVGGAVYRVVFDPAVDYAPASATLMLHDVPADLTGTLTINGDPLHLEILTAGQNAVLDLTVSTGQSARVHMSGSPFTRSPCVTVKLMQGTTVVQTTTSCAVDFFTIAQPLTAGSYTIIVDPGGNLTGSFNISVVNP